MKEENWLKNVKVGGKMEILKKKKKKKNVL